VRGLKLGMWLFSWGVKLVAPYTGAWIETVGGKVKSSLFASSHPTRVRGLKRQYLQGEKRSGSVAPYTGAWIETYKLFIKSEFTPSRTLHGCVD